MTSFADLETTRNLLQDFARRHFGSVLQFRWGTGPSFFIELSKKNSTEDPNPIELQHLTSSATCIESLLACPSYFGMSNEIDPHTLAKQFAQLAIERPAEKWKSEGSAAIYCRCRALPTVIRYLGKPDPRINDHIAIIFGQLGDESSRLAIGEADPDADPAEWYPPNAFHTYWTLEILQELQRLYPTLHEELLTELRLKRRIAELRLWSRAQLAFETALHSAKSSNLDSDQLAWSLSIAARFDTDIQSDLSRQDLFRQALKCLFETQKPVGTWRQYRPLFHYRNAGNAYCFVFETFAVLLRSCLERGRETTFFVDALKPYFKQLSALFEYAATTKTVNTSGEQDVLAWSSGHRTNKTEPESWATACVFDFVQSFRRLVGCWTREEAFLGINRVVLPSGNSARDLLVRGDTWSTGPNVAEQLSTLFLNPFWSKTNYDRFEPDGQPIGEHQARAAILFGPPGTSKTTIVRILAGALGWNYVEIHASHFVAQGLPNVQKTADEIFQRLMQLDHSVVLFDEIDELVRERSEKEADAFGRFLTTSMLPKLAELWRLRKVLYFVNTNHIRYFDNAIIRSGRFDALVFVAPPSFKAKCRHLTSLLKDLNPTGSVRIDLTEDEVEKVLTSVANRGRKGSAKGLLTDTERLAKFLLLRWDQLHELAEILAVQLQHLGDWVVNADTISTALAKISDQRLLETKHYLEFEDDRGYARRDHDKVPVYRVVGDAIGASAHCLVKENDQLWLKCPPELWHVKVPGFDIKVLESELGAASFVPKQKSD